MNPLIRPVLGPAALLAALAAASCGKPPAAPAADSPVRILGTFEVTARLEEIPEGAIFKRDLYDYATILKYTVLEAHRGGVKAGTTLHVGHYNPFKPRSEAADRKVKGIGGDLHRFQAGQLHRMALEFPLEDHFMGGIVNQYFEDEAAPLYWALWTDLAPGP